jgi:hypothetical protein
MKWDQVEWTAAKDGGRGPRRNNGLVSISKIKSGGRKLTARIGIPKEAMRAMSWRIGDKVNIFYAFDNDLLALVRVPNGSGRCTLNGNGKRAHGEICASCVQFTPSNKREYDFFPSNLTSCKWQPEEHGLVISIPIG